MSNVSWSATKIIPRLEIGLDLFMVESGEMFGDEGLLS